jgi:molecular chaperone DnaK
MIGGKKITDVTTHALGMISVSADGEKYITDVLIEKNSSVPCEKTLRRQLRVRRNGENELEVYVVQGSDPNPLNCDITGKYTCGGISYVESGQATIDITYKYDDNGIIDVSAVQVDTKRALNVIKEIEIGDMSWVGRSPKDNVVEEPVRKGEIFLVADLSGSMSGDPLKEAKTAMKKFVDDADMDIFKIGIMGVADKVRTYLKPSGNANQIKTSINSISIGDCGYGNDAHPFDALLKGFSNDCDIRYAIVLADGAWMRPAVAKSAAKICHNNGIEIIGLGFGTARMDFMEAISSQKDLAIITETSGLTSSFSKIAQVIGSQSGGISKK